MSAAAEPRTLPELLRDPRDARSFDKLVHALRDEQVIAMVGAGCSARLGYPAWSRLLDELHDLSADGEARQGARKGLRTYRDVLWRAEEYESLLTRDRFRSEVARRFEPRLDLDPVLDDLVRLPFRHVITTNYDPSLEEAHRRVHGRAPHVLNWADRERVRAFMYNVMDRAYARTYVYLHGRYDRPETIILTDSDYALRYVKTEETSKKLFALFAMHPVLFVGFSLEDPDLMALLREVNAALEFHEPRHFALVSVKETDDRLADRARLSRKFGIDAVFYDTTHDHEGLAVLMRGLVERCCEEPAGAGAASEAMDEYVVDLAPDDEPWEEEKADAMVVDDDEEIFTEEISFEAEDALGIPEGVAFEPDPDDPHKGRFGGLARRDGFELSASVTPDADDWFHIGVKVTAGDAAGFEGRPVRFHLHPTFPHEVVKVKPRGAIATLDLSAYGAFTVGAEVGEVRLELDLATLPDAPSTFVAR